MDDYFSILRIKQLSHRIIVSDLIQDISEDVLQIEITSKKPLYMGIEQVITSSMQSTEPRLTQHP